MSQYSHNHYRQRKKKINRTLEIITAVAGVIMICCAYAGHVNPTSFFPAPFMMLAYMPMVVVILLLMIAAIVWRHWLAVLIALLTEFVSEFAELFMLNLPQRRRSGQSLGCCCLCRRLRGNGYDFIYDLIDFLLVRDLIPDDVDLDVGTEALLRQICSMELDINRDRAAGRSVEKSVATLNTLLGSLNLKPVQRKQDEADAGLSKTPLGVWLYRYENKRPLPDDGSGDSKFLKYVFTWLGHVCKMLGVKNGYEQLYEDEIAKYRVEMPEYDGDDDEAFMTHVFESEADGDGQI